MLTTVALRTAVLLATLFLAAHSDLQGQSASSANPPSEQQQEEILRRASEYADNYISRLPDFLCTQRTEQFSSNKKGSRWKQGDTIESRLLFADGREKRTLARINGREPSPGAHRGARRPLTTEGEFGVLLANVLGAGSQANFKWEDWRSLDGRVVALFSYSMDREHSTLKLTLSDLAQAVVPYRGQVVADPANGEVWQITSEATDIPQQLDTRSIATTIDYQPVTIGGIHYLMPSKAVVLLITRSQRIRNELSFSGFQKFETGSTIKFGDSGDGGIDALPPGNGPPK